MDIVLHITSGFECYCTSDVQAMHDLKPSVSTAYTTQNAWTSLYRITLGFGCYCTSMRWVFEDLTENRVSSLSVRLVQYSTDFAGHPSQSHLLIDGGGIIQHLGGMSYSRCVWGCAPGASLSCEFSSKVIMQRGVYVDLKDILTRTTHRAISPRIHWTTPKTAYPHDRKA
jgi:hypothetical protein